ncbi:MAG: RNA polymerase sigma factor [bacterium]
MTTQEPETKPEKAERKESVDSELVRRCQAGDKSAYGRLVEKYMRRAYFTALGFTGHHESALDMSQEAFVRAYRAIKKMDAEKPFFTWYYQILRNLCLNLNRDRARRARPFSEIGEARLRQMEDGAEDTAERVEQAEITEALWRAINRLQPHEREIILLKEFQELSYKEIAELLECPPGTVMSRLYTARQALKSKLAGVFK